MPEDTQTKQENTDLIDVSDVATELEEATPRPRRARKAPDYVSDRAMAPTAVGELGPAPLKDRFAALAIDAVILYIIYWFLMVAYRAIALDRAAGPVPVAGIHGAIFHGLFLLIALFYFLLFESIFYATPGKLLCHVSVRRKDGTPPSIGACLLRTVMRPIDLILSPLIIPLACMEWTRSRSRLGDALAGTMVIRTLGSPRRQYALSLDMLPTASARLLSFCIDALLFAALMVGYGLLLSPEHPLVSMFLIVFAPVVCIFYFSIPEAALKTSLGKWICGYTVCHEDGSAVELPGAIIRTLFLPFDLTPFGYFATMFSIRHQRAGDVAAGTVICKVPRLGKNLIGIGILIALIGALLYAGMSNRHSFLSDSFEVNFLPSFGIHTTPPTYPEATKGILTIHDFQFAEGDPESVRRPAIFQPGEKVFLVFSVIGGMAKQETIWIQEDLTVRYPDGTTGLKLENIIDFRDRLEQPGPIEMTNNIALPSDAVPGRYTVSIVLRDKHSGRQLNEQRFFYVTPRRSPSRNSR